MLFITCLCFTDAPIFVSNQTIYYSWEGNPINISCDVLANPSASIHWRRGKLVLPGKNTTHLKTHSAGNKLILEVRLATYINFTGKSYFLQHYKCKSD